MEGKRNAYILILKLELKRPLRKYTRRMVADVNLDLHGARLRTGSILFEECSTGRVL
jgi:hypothetical protein